MGVFFLFNEILLIKKKKKRMEGKVLVQDSFSACVTYVCVCVCIYIYMVIFEEQMRHFVMLNCRSCLVSS